MYASRSLLITGIVYGSAKREALARLNTACDRLVSHVDAWVTEYDRKHYRTTPCDGTILCERQGVRHKIDCQGKVEPIEVFWKKVQNG